MRLGIDLGTSNLRVVNEKGELLLDEPSCIAFDQNSDKVLAVGKSAFELEGKSPGNVVILHPLQQGVIHNLDGAAALLKYALKQTAGRLFKPEVVVAVPVQLSGVEGRAYQQACQLAGARKTSLLPAPLAAGVGAGLDLDRPKGHLLLDLGGGTTEIAVISSHAVILGETLRWAGQSLDEAIIRSARQQHNLLVNPRTAEAVKLHLASAFPLRDDSTLDVHGKDLVNGLPTTIELSGEQVREAVEPVILNLVDGLKRVLESTPPELSADILELGIVLTGGLAKLEGLARLFHEITAVEVRVAHEPHLAVARGLLAAERAKL